MKEDINQFLIKRLGKKQQFTTRDLLKQLKILYPNDTQSTLSWRISDLKKNGAIHQIGRGLYGFEKKPDYTPRFTQKGKQLYKEIKNLMNGEILVLYESPMLADLLDIKRKKYIIILLVPKQKIEVLFYDILQSGKRVFLKPNKEVVQKHIMPYKESILIYPLISGMPIIEIDSYKTVSIESFLVASCIYNEIYLVPNRIDIDYIFQKAFEKYNINVSKLIRFATRRDRRHEIINCIKKYVKYDLGI